jgi:MATE family multidrug resistance protein
MAPPSSSEAHGFGGGGGGAAEPDGSDVALHLDADAEPLLKHTSVPARPPPHLHRAPSKATLAQELSAGGGWAHELSELGKLATPLILSAMSGFMVSMVGLVFVGRLGSQPLSVMILATSFFNVTGLAFLVGSLGAMETLCGQAYGARNYRAVGVALQRAVALTLVLAAGVCALWTQVERILVGLGQDPALAAGAARFLHLSMPSLFFLALGEALKRYLMAQNIVAPAMAAAAAGAAAAPLYFWLLIFRCGLGLDGAALAMNLAQATPMAVLAVWTARREAALAAAAAPERTWHGWSREALRGWGAYSRLAAPSAAVVCLEWWCFEA